MILRAKKIDGPEALRIGLVHEVWPIGELKERAQKLAQELAQMPALAVAEILRVVVGAGAQAVASGLVEERKAEPSTSPRHLTEAAETQLDLPILDPQ